MKPIYAIMLAALTVGATACSKDKKEETTKTDAAEELIRVELGVATHQDIDQEMVYTATVEAENINNISPQSPNRIKSILVDVGDPVRKGQTVATLDPVNIDQLKLQLADAQREYNRAVQLLEIGSGTQQMVDQLKTKVDGLVTQCRNMQENTVLTSPISGVVTARNYDPGDMTGGLPVVTVGQITPNVKVMINVSENDYKEIKKGMPVKVTFDAFEDEVFSGRVTRIHPTVDPGTRTFQVEIQISNPKGQIKPGMFARVSLSLGSVNHVVVPDRAVVNQPGSGNKFVYVYNNGKVSYNQVEVGKRLGEYYELISGVEIGDSVVITGQTRLADGVAVEVIER